MWMFFPDDGVDLLDGGGHVRQHGVVRLGVAQPRQRPPHVAQGRPVQDGEGVSVPGGLSFVAQRWEYQNEISDLA